MPPLKRTEGLSLPGQRYWLAPGVSCQRPLLFQTLYLHCAICYNPQEPGVITLQLTKEEMGHREVRCLTWKQLRWDKLGSACLQSPQLDSLPQNGLLEFSLGIALH